MNRRHFVWKLKSRELLAGERTLIMGVVNVTPDSFSDGGKYLDPDRAFARAIELEEQGADIIDVGAESDLNADHGRRKRHARLVFRWRQVSGSRSRLRPRHRTGRARRGHHRCRR